MTNKDTADSFNSSPLKTAPKGKTHLLAIAIDDYKQCSKLNNAVLDVEAFIEVMTTRYTLEPQQVILIKNTEATKKRIESAFDDLIDLVEPEDKLIIYFSGHGRHHERRGGFWVPVEAGKGDKDWPDYISNAVIRDYLSKINSFHTFLIADSCFSGALLIDKSKEKFTGDRRDTERSRWALTSGKKEIVSDGKPGAHSPFAAALLDVLRKAEEPLSVMRICDLVLEKVAANADQTPMGSPLKVEGHDAGQMVLYFREEELSPPTNLNPKTTITTQIDKTESPEINLNLAISRSKREVSQSITSMNMVLIEGGMFEMGDVISDLENDDETVHTVMIGDFLLAKYQLTFEEYDVFCEAIGQKPPNDKRWSRGKRPVIYVSWFDAIRYCNWRSIQEGFQHVYQSSNGEIISDWNANGYRLPTEAEWEYAARKQGGKVRFGNGKNIADPREINFYGLTNHKKSYSRIGQYRGKTIPVGSLNCPNALGLHDMSGNVWEWCWDWYTAYPNKPQNNPKGPREGTVRVCRGGSWNNYPGQVRVAARGYSKPDDGYDDIGFRLARRP